MSTTARPRVLVVGCGFGGIEAVRAATSIVLTSALRMVRLPRAISRLRACRIGALTAGALRPAVATW